MSRRQQSTTVRCIVDLMNETRKIERQSGDNCVGVHVDRMKESDGGGGEEEIK